jgi:hypothetical protein
VGFDGAGRETEVMEYEEMGIDAAVWGGEVELVVYSSKILRSSLVRAHGVLLRKQCLINSS